MLTATRASMWCFLVLSFLAVSVLGAPAPIAVPDAAPSPTVCNGSPALCSRRYSAVSFVGSHDSSFVGMEIGDNQFVSVTDQLNLGIRFLQTQSHLWGQNGNMKLPPLPKSKNPTGAGTTIKLCHTSCMLNDAGPLTDYLAEVKRWLDKNPNEVLTLLITNEDAIDVRRFGDAFSTAGLDSAAYVPPVRTLAVEAWPTLGELIASGKRLVVFMDYNMDQSAVPYILDEFAYYFETPYDVTDPKFADCSLDRPGGASDLGRMYIVNHFLDIEILPNVKVPHVLAAFKTNSVASITAQTDLCQKKWGRPPQVVLLDWINVPTGGAIQAQKSLNKL